jgi:hypothetical protein
MLAMTIRRLNKKYRIQAGTGTRETAEGFDRVLARYARAVEFQGRKLGTAPALNALVLEFLVQDDEERRRRLEEGVRRLEELLGRDEDFAAFLEEVDRPAGARGRDVPRTSVKFKGKPGGKRRPSG